MAKASELLQLLAPHNTMKCNKKQRAKCYTALHLQPAEIQHFACNSFTAYTQSGSTNRSLMKKPSFARCPDSI